MKKSVLDYFPSEWLVLLGMFLISWGTIWRIIYVHPDYFPASWIGGLFILLLAIYMKLDKLERILNDIDC